MSEPCPSGLSVRDTAPDITCGEKSGRSTSSEHFCCALYYVYSTPRLLSFYFTDGNENQGRVLNMVRRLQSEMSRLHHAARGEVKPRCTDRVDRDSAGSGGSRTVLGGSCRLQPDPDLSAR